MEEAGALIATAVLWRGQAKHNTAPGSSRLAVVYLVSFLLCFVCVYSFTALSRVAGVQNSKWFVQALWITSGLVAYFVAGHVVARLRARSG